MVSTDFASLINKTTESYTATASLNNDGLIDSSSSAVTGDRTTDLFKTVSKELGKDDFLQLLVTQLRYQDPINPMENTEFVSQLAQFRSLESGSNIEAAIEKLDESFKSTVTAQNYSAQSMTNSSSIAMIGKTVALKQTEINWIAKADQSEEIRVHLGNASGAVVKIKDSDGNVVKTFSANDKDSENSQTLIWDGTNDSGAGVSSGKYTIEIEGQDKNNELYAFVKGIISGVRFSANGVMVKIDGKEVSLGNVLDVSGEDESAAGLITPQTAVSLIGKDIRVKQDSVLYKNLDNEKVSISINTGGRSQVTVKLTDNNGNTVFSTLVQADQNGVADFSWNGMTDAGKFADAGEYFINIAGQNQDPTLYSFVEGKVTGVMNLGGDTRLRVGSNSVKLSDVIDIAESV